MSIGIKVWNVAGALFAISLISTGALARDQHDRWSEAQTNKNSYAARQEYLNKHSWSAYNSRRIDSSHDEMGELRQNSMNYKSGYRIDDLLTFMRNDPQGFCKFTYQSAVNDLGTQQAIFNAVNGNARKCHGDWYLMLAKLHFDGIGTAVDTAKAVEAYKSWAYEGNASAMADIASYYLKGQYVQQDQKEGLYWLEKAAKAKHIPSASHLAGAYYYGSYDLLPANQEKAVQYAQLAADAGNADAQYLLGMFRMTGDGVEKDTTQGIELLKLAAKSGQAEAQQILKEEKQSW